MRQIYSGLELLLLDCILPRYVNSSTGSTVLPSTIIGDYYWRFTAVKLSSKISVDVCTLSCNLQSDRGERKPFTVVFDPMFLQYAIFMRLRRLSCEVILWWRFIRFGSKMTCFGGQIYTLCLKKTTQLWNGIARNYMDRFWWYFHKYSKSSRILFACFSFHVGLLITMLSSLKLHNENNLLQCCVLQSAVERAFSCST